MHEILFINSVSFVCDLTAFTVLHKLNIIFYMLYIILFLVFDRLEQFHNSRLKEFS